MSELREFVEMGGYALYVWSSYGLTLLVIGGIVWWSALELRRTRERTLRRARERGPRRTPESSVARTSARAPSDAPARQHAPHGGAS